MLLGEADEMVLCLIKTYSERKEGVVMQAVEAKALH